MIYLPLEEAKKCIQFMRMSRRVGGEAAAVWPEGSTLERVQSFVSYS